MYDGYRKQKVNLINRKRIQHISHSAVRVYIVFTGQRLGNMVVCLFSTSVTHFRHVPRCSSVAEPLVCRYTTTMYLVTYHAVARARTYTTGSTGWDLWGTGGRSYPKCSGLPFGGKWSTSARRQGSLRLPRHQRTQPVMFVHVWPLNLIPLTTRDG